MVISLDKALNFLFEVVSQDKRKAHRLGDVGCGAVVVPGIPPRHGRQQARMVPGDGLPKIRK